MYYQVKATVLVRSITDTKIDQNSINLLHMLVVAVRLLMGDINVFAQKMGFSLFT